MLISDARGNALSGQVGGIKWWASHAELNIDIPEASLPNLLPDFLEPILAEPIETGGKALEVGLRGIRPLTYGLEGGGDIVDGVSDLFHGNFAEGAEDIWDGSGTILGCFVRTSAGLTFGVSQGNNAVNLCTRIFGWP